MTKFSLKKIVGSEWLVLVGLAMLKIVVHLFTGGAGAYGYFRDELYYLDCANHLGLGYVDHPPLSILILSITRAFIGDSMLAIRLPVICVGAATVVMTGVLVRQMGGGRFAQALACLAVLAAPIFLAIGSFFSMNAFDQFFWVLAALLIVRLIQTDNPRLWLWFGFVVGLGLQNKYSIGFFAGAIVAAMILTPYRKHFRRWELWVGGLIACFLFLPHIFWQVKYDWPTLEFMHNARLYKNMPNTFFNFLGSQIILIGPLNAPLWIAGLVFGFLSRRGKPFVLFCIAYLILFAVFLFTKGKVYYLSPIYPILLALGSVYFESIMGARRWAKTVLICLVALSGLILAPLALPILSPGPFLRYQQALGLRAPQQERSHGQDLLQHLSDRLGWEEFVAMVAQVNDNLDPVDQAKCSIIVSNYGEAGAINLLGKRYGLPPAFSGHNSNYLWGPQGATGEVMLVYSYPVKELEMLFDSVVEVGRFSHPYVMEHQNNRSLFLCRGLQLSAKDAWKQLKSFL